MNLPKNIFINLLQVSYKNCIIQVPYRFSTIILIGQVDFLQLTQNPLQLSKKSFRKNQFFLMPDKCVRPP